MRMKNRWIGGLVLAIAVVLGACAPPNQGGGASDEPSVPASAAPAESSGAESAAPEASAEASQPAPSYDYDY